MSNVHKLEPARPDPPDQGGDYMPKTPWKWILGIGGLLALTIGVYQVVETRELQELRAAVLKAHRVKVAPVVQQYESVIGRINAWTTQAAQKEQVETYVDERLNLDSLHKGEGLYLRVPADEARTVEGLVAASQKMGPDAITKCLGLTPHSARGLYAHGGFLTAEWVEQAEQTDSVMKLRVMAEEIRQRSTRDLPGVRNALQADWFMLVLERGENRRDAPVDVYLWSLDTNKLLLRTRLQAEGALVSARIRVAGAPAGHYAKGKQTGAAQDCSIASKLRKLTGRDSAEFSATPPKPAQAIASADATDEGEPTPEQGEAAAKPAGQ